MQPLCWYPFSEGMRLLRKSNLQLNTHPTPFFTAELRTLRRTRCSRASGENTNRSVPRERQRRFAMRQAVQPLATEADTQPLDRYLVLMRQTLSSSQHHGCCVKSKRRNREKSADHMK